MIRKLKMISLEDKTVIITGASSGLGRALALRLAKEKCKLVLSARRLEKLKEVESEAREINQDLRPLIVKADISKEKDVIELFNKAANNFGKIDILINNAGKGLPAKIHEISKADWDSVIHTNLDSVFLSSREAINHMLKENEGHIITVCSMAGLYPAPGFSAYCASKHAVAGFKRSLRLELRKKRIKISTIYPARINTKFFKNYKKKPLVKEMVSAEDIADYIVSIMKRHRIKRALKKIQLIYKRFRNLL